MNLKEYIEQLQEVLNENPNYSELTVIYAKDDEGNGYNKVGFAPSLGNFNAEKDFNEVDNFEDLDECDRIVNSICVN